MAVAAVRTEHPLLFADVNHVADRLIAAESGMGTAVFDGMRPKDIRTDGAATSVASWGG